jgi:WD40 repeat protein
VTFSTNGNLNVWTFNPQKQIYELYSATSYKKKLQDVIALTILDNDYLLLLSGGYDNLINVHVLKRFSENNNKKDNKKPEIEFKLSLQGHANSIRDLAFSPSLSGDSELKGKDLLFASCSQDTYIRLWHVSKISKEEIEKLVANMTKKEASSIYEEYKNKMSYVFKTKEQEYFNIVLDSVLAGHEEPVSSVRWGIVDNKNVLLTSSFDFTIGIWKWDDNMVNSFFSYKLIFKLIF